MIKDGGHKTEAYSARSSTMNKSRRPSQPISDGPPAYGHRNGWDGRSQYERDASSGSWQYPTTDIRQERIVKFSVPPGENYGRVHGHQNGHQNGQWNSGNQYASYTSMQYHPRATEIRLYPQSVDNQHASSYPSMEFRSNTYNRPPKVLYSHIRNISIDKLTTGMIEWFCRIILDLDIIHKLGINVVIM